MSSKYYAHFVTESQGASPSEEFTGVVEVDRPLRRHRETRDLRSVLARNYDVQTDEIRILQWAVLH